MSNTNAIQSIPVLDFSLFETDPTAFLSQLKLASRDVGFFYLTGHGIPQSLIDDVLASSRRFFALPEADKLEIEMVNSPHFRGYNRVGQELTKGQRDWREQIDIGSEAPPLVFGKDQPAWTRLQGPNLWPNALPELKPILLGWQSELTRLATRLLKAFAVALEQDRDVFETIYAGQPNHLIKIRAGMPPEANRVSAPIRTAASLPCCCRKSRRGWRSRPRMAAGSRLSHARALLSSTSASCWNWSPTAI